MQRQKKGDEELPAQDGVLTAEQATRRWATLPNQTSSELASELGIALGRSTPTEAEKNLGRLRQRTVLGEVLVRLGIVTYEQIQAALEQQKKTKQKLGEILLQRGWVTESALLNALQSQTALSKKKPGKFDLLVAARRLSQDELDAALADARQQQRAVETLLMERHHLSKAELGHAFGLFYQCPFIEYHAQTEVAPDLVGKINLNYLRANYWLPLRATAESVEVLIDDPQSFDKIQDIKRLFPGKEIRCAVGLRDDILKYINGIHAERQAKATVDPITAILGQLEAEGVERVEDSSEQLLDENDSGVVRLVNQIITDAYKMGASDIHIEPYGEQKEMAVRIRIDGRCHDYLKVPSAYRRVLVSRLKVMARLDIAERRKPQDGKIKFRTPDREIELRIATIPTAGLSNEDVVLRILSTSEPIPLDQLKMSERNLQEFSRLLDKPYGMILCVGPTGSGKTTTLHSALGQINTPDRKIWTAEDPVEITQYGLRQVQVHPKIGFTFATAMRAFLRADPDVIMVGEIRDGETAEVSVEASLTGHLVFSTLHTNSAVETVTRLLEMGIDPFSFADALLGVLAQRLARTLCAHCKEPYHPHKEDYDALAYGYGEQAFAALDIPYDGNFLLSWGRGCAACHQTGYKGRIGIHELLVVNEEIRRLIHTRATIAEMFRVAVVQGMKTLVQDGIRKVLQGWTDYNQVKAVAKLDETR